VLERVSFELGAQKSQFRISMQTPVENPLLTIESFNRQFQVEEKERELIKLGWEQELSLNQRPGLPRPGLPAIPPKAGLSGRARPEIQSIIRLLDEK
jgi:hypothetical protein